MKSGKAYWEQGGWWIAPDETPNLSHIETMYGKTNGVPVQYEIPDKRKARPKQRRLFFALLSDIHRWSGEPAEWLKEYFYLQYTIKTAGKEISLSDATTSTVSDATELINLVIDFIFDYQVPIKDGYPLLPRDESYFQFKCIQHRQCLICGKPADINHVDEVGMGRNRNKLDHTQARLSALCRVHHQEWHQIGNKAFCDKYRLTNLGVKVDAATLARIGVKGAYQNE